MLPTSLAAPADDRALVAGLLMIGFAGLEPGELDRACLAELQPGGLILFRRNWRDPAQLRRLVHGLREVLGPDLLLAVDQEGGPVQRLREPLSRLPPMARLGEADDPELARALGAGMARELRSLGLSLDFSPVLDLRTRPDDPIIGERAFGAQPERVAALGCALLEGLQAWGVAACGKHFPGHGDSAVDSHLDLPVLPHDLARLRALELRPFAAAAQRGVASIMVGHLLLPALDPALPASLSPTCVTGLLREELGYPGVVVTDDLEMEAVAARWGFDEAACLAVEAGCDLILVCHRPERQRAARDGLLAALRGGRIPRRRFEQSWERLALLRATYPPLAALPDPPALPDPVLQSLLARWPS